MLLAASLARADRLLAEAPAGVSPTGVELLLLAVLASALRDDPRCVLLAGVLSALLLRGHAPGPLLALAAGTALCALLVARARRLYPLAEHEALTGLPRRTAFEQRLALETARSHRHERTFALALVGIADLPRLIEQQGHARGNAVLRAAASLLRRTLRQTDTVASLEPGLLALLLPETRVASAEPRKKQFETNAPHPGCFTARPRPFRARADQDVRGKKEPPCHDGGGADGLVRSRADTQVCPYTGGGAA